MPLLIITYVESNHLNQKCSSSWSSSLEAEPAEYTDVTGDREVLNDSFNRATFPTGKADSESFSYNQSFDNKH